MHGRWLYVGHLNAGQTSLMRLNAMRRCGVAVDGFNTRAVWNDQGWLRRNITIRTERGRAVREINAGIVAAAQRLRPNFVWFDKQEFVNRDTLLFLREIGAFLVYYTPDPYFTLAWKRTRLMDACLPLFHLLVTSKTYEVKAFESVGSAVMYLPLGYCDEVHRPIPVAPSDRVSVGFVGGWEPRRQAILEAIARRGVSARVWGYGWDHLLDGKWTLRRYLRLRRLAGEDNWQIRKSDALRDCILPGEIYGADYAAAISMCDTSLGFLRTICPDQHTTRSFEIPACGSMLLADRTAEHQEFFEEGVEAEYFASDQELVDKAVFYHRNPKSRERIAAAGHERCVNSGYSYVSRMGSVLARVKAIV